MTDPTVPQTVLFPELTNRPVAATVDHPLASSDGGAVLLKAAADRAGVIAAVAATRGPICR